MFSWEVFFVLALTGCEVDAPAELYGRELGLFYALTTGGLAIGAPLTGVLLDVTSVQVGLLTVGIAMIAFAAWCMSACGGWASTSRRGTTTELGSAFVRGVPSAQAGIRTGGTRRRTGS